MSASVKAITLPDVQGQEDRRGIALDEVGVSELRIPITAARRDGAPLGAVAKVRATASLAADQRGTHMSRFVQAVAEDLGPVSTRTPETIADRLREMLEASEARVEICYASAIDRESPISAHQAPLCFDVRLIGQADERGRAMWLEVKAPVTSLCPCSKEIADYGAHSQRGYVDVSVQIEPGHSLWAEDLVDVISEAGSAPIYPLLKRDDERLVTMQAYDNPAFVEDIARSVVLSLREKPEIRTFTIEVANEESIHDHQAIARVSWRADEA